MGGLLDVELVLHVGNGGEGGLSSFNIPPSPPSPTASYEQDNRHPLTTPSDSGEACL
jgi:hypothetical protein